MEKSIIKFINSESKIRRYSRKFRKYPFHDKRVSLVAKTSNLNKSRTFSGKKTKQKGQQSTVAHTFILKDEKFIPPTLF